MPFKITEEEILKTETLLGAKLPFDYRESMKEENGGEAETEEDDWELYPIKDSSSKKLLSRTCNDIINETKSCKGFGNFPENVIAIANNGFGDQMIFKKNGNAFDDKVYFWSHETGEITLLAERFNQINKI